MRISFREDKLRKLAIDHGLNAPPVDITRGDLYPLYGQEPTLDACLAVPTGEGLRTLPVCETDNPLVYKLGQGTIDLSEGELYLILGYGSNLNVGAMGARFATPATPEGPGRGTPFLHLPIWLRGAYRGWGNRTGHHGAVTATLVTEASASTACVAHVLTRQQVRLLLESEHYYALRSLEGVVAECGRLRIEEPLALVAPGTFKPKGLDRPPAIRDAVLPWNTHAERRSQRQVWRWRAEACDLTVPKKPGRRWYREHATFLTGAGEELMAGILIKNGVDGPPGPTYAEGSDLSVYNGDDLPTLREQLAGRL